MTFIGRQSLFAPRQRETDLLKSFKSYPPRSGNLRSQVTAYEEVAAVRSNSDNSFLCVSSVKSLYGGDSSIGIINKSSLPCGTPVLNGLVVLFENVNFNLNCGKNKLSEVLKLESFLHDQIVVSTHSLSLVLRYEWYIINVARISNTIFPIRISLDMTSQFTSTVFRYGRQFLDVPGICLSLLKIGTHLLAIY